MFRIFSKLLSASGSGRVKNVHRLTLLVNDVRNRSRYIFLFPEISRTTMARPALAIRRVETGPIQRSACRTLEAVHHNFWSDAGSDYCMHVVGPNVRGEQHPAAMGTRLTHRLQDELTAVDIELVRRLIHPRFRGRSSAFIRLEQAAPRKVVQTINGSSFIAVQACSVACECYEIRHRDRSFTLAARFPHALRVGAAR